MAFLFLFCFSQLYVIANNIALAKNADPRLYYKQEEFAAMKWLKIHTPEDAVILSNPETSNLLPGRSDRMVFAGHTSETANWDRKLEEVVNWYATTRDNGEEKYNFLKKKHITYIWYGDGEKKLGKFDPATMPQLKKIFSNNVITIFAVH